MNSFDYFSNYIFPPLIFSFGLIGNLIGFKVMQRPKMLEIGPRNMYKYLFIIDTIYLVQIIVTNLQLSYNIDITLLSNSACKLWNYLTYSLDAQSVMLLVYISIDRYVSIKVPALRYFLRKRNNQLIYFIFIFMLNLLYYLPVAYDYTLTTTNDTSYNNVSVCDFNSEYSQNLISFMDFVNLIIIPSFLIVLFSILLGIEVIKSKNRILSNFKTEENKFYFKNIRLAISSIFLNIIYVLLVTPLSIFYFIPNYNEIEGFVFSYYLLYSAYSINFYMILISDSMFRKECISFFASLIKLISNK
jgi:hypothetical protein